MNKVSNLGNRYFWHYEEYAKRIIQFLMLMGLVFVDGIAIEQVTQDGIHSMQTLNRQISEKMHKEMEEQQEQEEKRQIQINIERKILLENILQINTILKEISTTYTENNTAYRNEVEGLLENIKAQIRKYPEEFNNFFIVYRSKRAELYSYDAMIESIFEKIDAMEVSTYMDMSEAIYFTKEELEYLILNLKRPDGKVITEDKQLAASIAQGIVNKVEEKPVNELFVLAVMSYESYYFENERARETNNFSGMMSSSGRLLECETTLIGAEKSVECLYKNMKKGTTIYDINKSYAKPLNEYKWAKKVIAIMRTYAETQIEKTESTCEQRIILKQ